MRQAMPGFREIAGLMFRSDQIDPYWNNRFIWHADIAAARPATAR